ncbi:olfactory receptor 14A16-like [Hemicordylus capensis]|uniref:olfactory receptor 14A16-like n=1 Tax=Hemicordylus capensis TaxID=884348 RepID=UPI0023027655|nr:olfactory receptor 14A16-like [Hemicordylus capensis]
MSNQSKVTEFLLLGFVDIQELQIFHNIIFLIIYLLASMENLLIITVIIYSRHLHTPMYIFLANLSFQDFGSISVTVPKSMANSLMNTQAISYSGCVSQVFFLVFFMISHFFLLGVMSYDRYVAICNPLHYETMMNKKVCIQMAIGAWLGGLFYSILYTGNAFTVEFCSNVVYQFFCEIPQLLKIACSDSYDTEIWILTFGASLCFIYFTLVIFSYVQIIRAVLKIPSTKGKQKAFSTCMPHLIVISLFLVSGTFAYLKPTASSPSALDLLVSILYCIVPPVMNPLIYTMRNTEIKKAFWKVLACQGLTAGFGGFVFVFVLSFGN